MDKNLFLELVRGLLSSSQPSGAGGLVGWLRRRIDPQILAFLVSNLGVSFDRETLYRWLVEDARITCCSPGCNNATKFDGRSMEYKRYCSSACSWRDPATIALREENELARSGGMYKNVSQRPEVRAKSSEVKKTQNYKDGIRKRELDRSNGASSDPRGRKSANEKRVASHRKNELRLSDGVRTNSSQREDVRSKISETLRSEQLQESLRNAELDRSKGLYCNPSQRPSARSAQRRSAFSRYEVVYNGFVWNVQGYEDVVLKFLVETVGICPEHISVPNELDSFKVPTENPNRFSRYIPDLYIKNSLYVEVKSPWTAEFKKYGKSISDRLLDRGKSIAASGKCLLILIVSDVKGAKGTGVWREGDIKSFALFTPSNVPLEYDFSTENIIKEIKDYHGK